MQKIVLALLVLLLVVLGGCKLDPEHDPNVPKGIAVDDVQVEEIERIQPVQEHDEVEEPTLDGLPANLREQVDLDWCPGGLVDEEDGLQKRYTADVPESIRGIALSVCKLDSYDESTLFSTLYFTEGGDLQKNVLYDDDGEVVEITEQWDQDGKTCTQTIGVSGEELEPAFCFD